MSTTPSTPLEAGLAAVIDLEDAKIAELQRQIDAIRAQIAAGGGGTNTTGSGPTPPTWTALAVPSLSSSTGWTPEGSGATVGGGTLTTSGTYMGGKVTALVTGVTPGKQLRVTFTVDATRTTGGALPYVSFVNQSTNPWSWPDPVGMTPDLATSVRGTSTYQCTVPAGATAVYVGAMVDTGTAVITGIKVEQA